MKSRVLVVDHSSSLWTNLNGNGNPGDYELNVVEDGLEAFMELNQNNFETVLVREDLPGVPGTELAEAVLEKRPELNVVLFGQNGGLKNAGVEPDHVAERPETESEATNLLEEAMSMTTVS